MNALGYAISTEIEGNKYYLNQAEINKGNSLYKIFLMLAQDEKNHEMILRNKLIEKPCKLIYSDTLLKAKNIFLNIGNFKSELRDTPKQLELYMMALQKEQASIDLYTAMLLETSKADEKELFEYLIQQENQHFEVLDQLVVSLSHAEYWVENAEFGLMTTRGEY